MSTWGVLRAGMGEQPVDLIFDVASNIMEVPFINVTYVLELICYLSLCTIHTLCSLSPFLRAQER